MTFPGAGAPQNTPGFLSSYQQSTKQAEANAAEMTGWNIKPLTVPAPEGSAGTTPFYFWILPSYEGIQQRNLAEGPAIFVAPVYRRIAGTTQCYYSPSVRFPGTAAPAGRDLIEQYLEQIGMRWKKSNDLSKPQQEFRRSISHVNRVMMQVCMLDARANVMFEADGTPMVRVFELAQKFFLEQGWESKIVELASQFGVTVTDVRRGCALMGARRGAGQTDTSYPCTGAMFGGQPYALARNADNSPNEALIQAVLAKVRPWNQVLEVPSEAVQTQILQSIAQAAANVGIGASGPAPAPAPGYGQSAPAGYPVGAPAPAAPIGPSAGPSGWPAQPPQQQQAPAQPPQQQQAPAQPPWPAQAPQAAPPAAQPAWPAQQQAPAQPVWPGQSQQQQAAPAQPPWPAQPGPAAAPGQMPSNFGAPTPAFPTAAPGPVAPPTPAYPGAAPTPVGYTGQAPGPAAPPFPGAAPTPAPAGFPGAFAPGGAQQTVTPGAVNAPGFPR